MNFFRINILISLIPANFLFQLTQGEKAEVVANYDHLQNLTAPPMPGRRPIATIMSYAARFADAFPVAPIVSTLSRHLRWNHFVNLAQCKRPVENRISSDHFDPTSNKIKLMTMKVSKGLEFHVVALPGVGHIPAPGEDEREAVQVFLWRLRWLLRDW